MVSYYSARISEIVSWTRLYGFEKGRHRCRAGSRCIASTTRWHDYHDWVFADLSYIIANLEVP